MMPWIKKVYHQCLNILLYFLIDVVRTINRHFFALKTRSRTASVMIYLIVVIALSCHFCDVELS